MHMFRALLCALLAFLATACTTQGTMRLDVDQEQPLDVGTFSFDQETMNYDTFGEYRLQPGDELDVLYQIRTWLKKANFKISVDHTVAVKFVNNPDLNEEQRVRPDGYISLPYIGEYYVIDKTVDEVRKDLQARYARELKDPQLYVLVPEFQDAIKEFKKDLHTAPRGLSRLVTVRPDGRVTFPMVGEFHVSGLTIQDVADRLNSEYEHLLPGLHVDVFLQRHSGALIYLVGEVHRPGAVPITKPISVLQALALAEGFTPAARLDSVVVARRTPEGMTATRLDVKSLLGFGEGQTMFYLKPDDIIVVPKLWIAQAADLTNYLTQAVAFRGWSISGSYELHDATARDSRVNRLFGGSPE